MAFNLLVKEDGYYFFCKKFGNRNNLECAFILLLRSVLPLKDNIWIIKLAKIQRSYYKLLHNSPFSGHGKTGGPVKYRGWGASPSITAAVFGTSGLLRIHPHSIL